jgi:hypothetical protein
MLKNLEKEISNLKKSLVNLVVLYEGMQNSKTYEQELGYRILLGEYVAVVKELFFREGHISSFDERLIDEIKIFKILYELYPNFETAEIKEVIDLVLKLKYKQKQSKDQLIQVNYLVALKVYDIFKSI